ncbi:MAG: energy transducer TonB, partial [Rhodothermales bacterium]|nr:energy transducer TonB [Rhodothermales bacterium]
APDLPEGDADASTSAPSVETAPKPVRIVEPEFPRAARRKGVRAEVVVRVLVDARGRVQQTEIVERFLLKGREDAREAVPEIGFGVEESVLAAAERWLFRPARKDGQAVTSYTTFTLSIGVQ